MLTRLITSENPVLSLKDFQVERPNSFISTDIIVISLDIKECDQK